MKRREFLQGITAISVLPLLSIKPKEHGILPVKIKDPTKHPSDATVLWCQIDFSEGEVNRNKHSMEAIESLVDAKLANAKETIMTLFEENL